MKGNTAKFLAAALVLLVTAGSVVARDGHGGHHRGPAGQPEIRAYYRANVLPVLQQQRQKLEPQLAAADRTQLATYRTQLQALKAQSRALHQHLKPSTDAPATRPTLTEAQREQARQLRVQSHEIMQKVGEMAQKYEATITTLMQGVQPQREQWMTDMKAIAAKNATPEQQQRHAEAQGNQGKGHGHRHGHGPMGHLFKPARFLLLDPAAPAAGPATRGTVTTSFYPNPAAPVSQLEYEVKKAGPVTVTLLDKNGREMRTLLTENEEKGPHSHQLNLQDLPAGTYYYKITTKSGSETKRFVKE